MNDRVLCRVGVDIGGAFTDIVLLLPDGSMTTRKVRSTPADSSVGIVECLTQLLAEYALSGDAIDEIVHGTTVATNMILEYTGARTALLTTAGFREGSPSPTNASDQKKRNTTAECHDLGAFRLAKNSVSRPPGVRQDGINVTGIDCLVDLGECRAPNYIELPEGQNLFQESLDRRVVFVKRNSGSHFVSAATFGEAKSGRAPACSEC